MLDVVHFPTMVDMGVCSRTQMRNLDLILLKLVTCRPICNLQSAKSVKRIPEFITIFCFGKLGGVRGWFESTCAAKRRAGDASASFFE